MSEVIEGYAMVFTSMINFLFTLDFSDGTSVGGILLAIMVLSLIIRFLFRQIQAGPSADFQKYVISKKQDNQVLNSAYDVLTRGD